MSFTTFSIIGFEETSGPMPRVTLPSLPSKNLLYELIPYSKAILKHRLTDVFLDKKKMSISNE